MKKILLSILLLSTLSLPMSAQTSTSTQVYDMAPWDNDGIIKLFANAIDQGRKFPTQAEFEAAGIYLDGEFVRSHVRYAPILEQNSTVNAVKSNSIAELFPTRRLWMNLPTGQGKYAAGYPSSVFNSDTYSMWNYTHIYGAWNHSVSNVPAAWVDAAHKNGTYMYSGIKFFESWGTNSSAWNNFIATKNSDGTYKYVDAVINAMIYFGHDGINYNFEDSGYKEPDVVGFHRALYKRAAELGLDNFHIGMYTSMSSLSGYTNWLLGDMTKGKICDVMLNYSANKIAYNSVPASLTAAKNAMGTAEDVYQGGLLVSMDQYWTQMAANTRKEMNLCMWGEHAVSRFFQFVVGTTLMNTQENYQLLLEKGFSGAYRNTLYRPNISNSGHTFQVDGPGKANEQLANYHGFAALIPERSAIQGNLPFQTFFSLGNGEIYFYKGKKTHGSWYNMAQQDYVPTYRWRQTAQGDMTQYRNALDIRFTHEDAYIGGSCLRLSGKQTGCDVILYRTKLKVNGAAKATLALKGSGAGSSCLSLIVVKNGQYIEVPYGNLTGSTWETKTLDIAGLGNGDVVEYIGLRVGTTDENYRIHVGQIKLEDGTTTACAAIDPQSVVTEVKEETNISLSVKLNWKPVTTGVTAKWGEWDQVSNEELNIDHFEIFYKDGENGRVCEVGRTSSWAAYVGNIQLEADSKPYIGVRAQSVDLSTCSPIVWTQIDRYNGTMPTAFRDVYDPTYINETSENYQVALTNRYFEQVSTTGADQNLSYTRNKPVGGTNYVYEADHVLKVHQGQTFTFTFKGADLSDNIKYCFIKGYMDWDINHDFNSADGSDELIFTAGELNKGVDAIVSPGITVSITVPNDAAIGTSRLRMVASDAWFPHPGPYGGTAKGFSIDFPVEITGTNTPREAAKTYKDYRDQGLADEPDNMTLSGIHDITLSGVGNEMPDARIEGQTLRLINTDKAWLFNAAGQAVKFISTPTASLTDLIPGIYVIRLQKGNYVRSTKFVKE